MTGAVLVRPREADFQHEEMELAKAAKFLGGEIDIEKIKSLRSSIGMVHLACRDARGRLVHEEIPIPLGNDDFLLEFQSRLGTRWLGEVADRQAAEKKLHLGVGFLKTVFYLLLFLGVLVFIVAFGLYSLAAPASIFCLCAACTRTFRAKIMPPSACISSPTSRYSFSPIFCGECGGTTGNRVASATHALPINHG